MRQPSSPGRTLLRPLLVFSLILSLVSVLPVSAARLQAPDAVSYTHLTLPTSDLV